MVRYFPLKQCTGLQRISCWLWLSFGLLSDYASPSDTTSDHLFPFLYHWKDTCLSCKFRKLKMLCKCPDAQQWICIIQFACTPNSKFLQSFTFLPCQNQHFSPLLSFCFKVARFLPSLVTWFTIHLLFTHPHHFLFLRPFLLFPVSETPGSLHISPQLGFFHPFIGPLIPFLGQCYFSFPSWHRILSSLWLRPFHSLPAISFHLLWLLRLPLHFLWIWSPACFHPQWDKAI